MKSVRIGGNQKSVKVKEYILEFYFCAMGLEMWDAKRQAEKELNLLVEIYGAENVTGDDVGRAVLNRVLESERFQD